MDQLDTSSAPWRNRIQLPIAKHRTVALLYNTINTLAFQYSLRYDSDPDLPRLSSFLHNGSDLPNHHSDTRVLSIDLPISLSTLSCLRHQYSEIRSHTTVNDSDVGADDGYFLEGGVVDEGRWGFFRSGEYNSIGGCGDEGEKSAFASRRWI